MKQELVALVTGAANGIGKAVAIKLASRGISLLMTDLNQETGVAAASEIARNYNIRVEFLQGDISNEMDIKRAVEASASLTGRLDYAANCAGICETIASEESSITTAWFDKYVTHRDLLILRFCLPHSQSALVESTQLMHGDFGYARNTRRSKCKGSSPGSFPSLIRRNIPFLANEGRLQTLSPYPVWCRSALQHIRPASMLLLELPKTARSSTHPMGYGSMPVAPAGQSPI